MNLFSIFLVSLNVLRVRTTIQEIFDHAQEIDRKYFELIEVTAEILNRNLIKSNTQYVATIGVNNEHYISNNVLSKISTAAVASPSEVHALAKNSIIFAKNFSEISVVENLEYVHRSGGFFICVTRFYSTNTEFLQQFIKAVSDLWRNRVSRMIFIAWIGDELNIMGIRPYDERTCFPNELIKIGAAKNGRMIKKSPVFGNVKNLNKCPLRVVTKTERPYAETFVENNRTRVKGIEGKIFNILSNHLNFTPFISDLTYSSEFDPRFDDCKDLLMANESDLCFGGKKVNVQHIEPTVSIMDCKKIWVVPKSGSIPPWMQVIIPFEKPLWVLLIFTVFFVGVACLILGNKLASLINMWSLFLGVSVELKNRSVRKGVKILLALWIFFSYVVTRAYLTSLETYLTKPNFLPEIDSLEELVASGIPIEGHPIVRKLFCLGDNKNSTMTGDMCSRYKLNSIEAIFEDIKLKGKLEVAFTMKAEVFKNSKFLRDYEAHKMHEVLLQYPTAFLAQTGAPFLGEMNVVLTRLIEAGFVNLGEREHFLIKDKEKHYPEKLRVEHVSGIMFVAMLGYALSVTVFCIEYLANSIDFRMLKKSRSLMNKSSQIRNIS